MTIVRFYGTFSRYEALQKLPDTNEVRFVLEVTDQWGRDATLSSDEYIHGIEYGLGVILYKVPGNIPFGEWIQQIRDTAAAELQEELAGVDNV